MNYSIIRIVVLFSLSTLLSCDQREEENTRPTVVSITITGIEILSLSNEDSNQRPWDEDSNPDLFLSFSSSLFPITTMTDTIQDFNVVEDRLTLRQNFEITPEVELFRIQLIDLDDIDPTFPAELQWDDVITSFTVFPWSEGRINLVETDELILSNRLCEMKITVERR